MPFVVICKFHYIVHVVRGSVHSRSITWRWCPALTRSSRPRGQTSTWTKLKPGRWTVSLPLVPLLTFILKFVKGSVWHTLIYTSHRCLQERFRECLRRRTCLWATWNQRHLMHCELCSSLFCLAVVIKVNWNEFMTSFVCTCWSRFSSVCGDEFLSHSGSGSGGYLHHVFNYAAKHLFGEDVKELTYKILKWVCVACLQKLDWKWALSSSGSSSVEKMV